MLIIFDCDGVLVDSEKLGAEVFSLVLEDFGITMTAQQCFDEFKGRSLKDCFNIIENEFSTPLPSHFKSVLDEKTEFYFNQDLQPITGVSKVIELLNQNNVKKCVASNGGKQKIKNSLNTTQLLSHFDYRFSVEDVERGKPAPDLFLYAAEQMDEKIENCWVIEDSEAGVKAATSANMNVIYFQHEGTNEKNIYASNTNVFLAYSMEEVFTKVESLLPKTT